MHRYLRRTDSYPAHGDCSRQRVFLDSTREYYRAKRYHSPKEETYKNRWGFSQTRTVWECSYWYDRKETVINWCYKWGRDYQVLFMSHDQFRRWLLGTDKEHTKASYWYRISWYRNGYGEECTKFRKKSHIKKKERSAEYLQKQEWRKKKGFSQDQQKKKGYHRNCPRWLKRYCNKKHRQMERRYIEHDQHDRLHSVTPKNLFDPWMWD